MIKHLKQFLVLALYLIMIPAEAVEDGNDDRFMLGDANTVSEAVDIISEALEEQGFEITFVLDHAANAGSVGLKLRPTRVIFYRKAQTERKLINSGQTTAIDMPLKFLVFEDAFGNIRVTFNPIGYLIDRHDIRLQEDFLGQLQNTLSQFAPLGNGLITVDSDFPFEVTVENVRSAIESRGTFRIVEPLFIDFSASTKGAVRPTTLIVFGNPSVGTQLMQNSQSIGIDLPQEILVWVDEDDEIHITYNDPEFIARRHGVQGLDELLQNIATVLRDLSEEGAGR